VAARASVAVSAASRRLHVGGGSVIGGRVGLLLDPDLLVSLSEGRRAALVSATNGKTTTTRLLCAALGGPDAVATSAAGANLPSGLAVALAAARPGAPAVLEVDEGYLPAVLGSVRPEVVVLLNLSRDQLDRVSEVRMVAGRWRAAFEHDRYATVVANADDPLVVWGAQTSPRAVWVAAGQVWHRDAVGCPACEGSIVFADDGDWWCSCGFRRPSPEVHLRGGVLETADGRHLAVRLQLPGRFNRANAAMAATAARVLGVDEADALTAMRGVDDVEGRFALVSYRDRQVRLLLAKNPAGWAELLDMLDGGTDPVVVGINARIADGHDPSWLWDVPFERLSGRFVVATGERGRDLAVRLRHAGVDHRTEPDQLRALAAAEAARLEYIGNYTAFQDLRRRLARHHGRAARPTPTEATPPSTGSAARPVASTGQPARPPASGPSALRVVVVHPDLLGTYGDGGNGQVLAGRARWRGIPVELLYAESGSPLPAGADVYCLGGGEDGPQVLSAELLRRSPLERAVDAGAVVLAVCAGYQIVGMSFPDTEGRLHPGVGLLDVVTVKGTGRRAVGELAAELAPPADGDGAAALTSDAILTGFENHSAVTALRNGTPPLGRVITGVGNGSGDGTEGARRGRVVGTYLHGPVLARNPALADLLLELATGTAPTPLDDREELALRAERLDAIGRRGHHHTAGRGARSRSPKARVRVRRWR
jgi:CobQ-like glutamine amidotransferase family enzyme/UDP-N-acetylmuramyl tripeptide synthase